MAAAFFLVTGALQAASVTKSANKTNYLLGDTVTWSLVVQPGDAAGSVTYQNPMSSLPAGWTNPGGGGWAGASWGIRAEGCSAGLNYGPYGAGAANQYPQFISNFQAPANVEFDYQACLPTTATSGDDDTIFIPRYIDCQHYYMVRGDQWQLSNTCGGNSMLFADSVAPSGGPCTTVFNDGNGGANGVSKASIPCIQRNTWYDYRVRICNGELMAKAWQDGTTEPGWEIDDPGAVPNAPGSFGFQANQGDITFRNLSVYALGAESNVVVTDTFPSCLTGLSSACGSFSGSNFTWNVGSFASACATPVTCNVTSTISCACPTGPMTNIANVTSSLGAGAPSTAVIDIGGFTLNKTTPNNSPITANGPITYFLTLCNTGSTAYNAPLTLQDNLAGTGSINGLQFNGYGLGSGNLNDTNNWHTGPWVSSASVDMISNTATSPEFMVENIPGSSCVSIGLFYQINGFPSEPCTVMSNSASIVTGGSCPVTTSSVPVTVCNSTPTFTPTPTNTFTRTPTFTPTKTATATPSPTPTLSPTPTNTPSNTPTKTPTFTSTNTPTKTSTFTPTNSPTATPTATLTNTPTKTPSFTPTPTPTNTVQNTPTNTPTLTPTKTPTASPTNTPTLTNTATPSNTPTKTPSATPTNTPTFTNTATPTNTLANTATNTPTKTPSFTPTNTPTATPTNSPTLTPTFTLTATPTSTFTKTPTASPTNTPTLTNTATPTQTYVNTPTPTDTFTKTPTATPTSTPTVTNTYTPTNTPTLTPTRTPTATPTNTFIITATPTATPTNTFTLTNTYTPTNSPTNTFTATPTDTFVNTPTPTDTPTVTDTQTPTNTLTSTDTPTPTASPTDTPTATPTDTLANTATDTPTKTPTATPTNSFTPTPTATLPNTATATPTKTPTATPTPTTTSTFTATPSNTATATSSSTPTKTPTATSTATPTLTPTWTATSTPSATPTPPLTLALVKTVSKTSVQAGDILTYTLHLTVSGNSALNGVVTDILPPNLSYVGPGPSSSAGFPNPGYNAAVSQLTWNLPSPLSPGNYTVSYQAQVANFLVSGTVINNCAQFSESPFAPVSLFPVSTLVPAPLPTLTFYPIAEPVYVSYPVIWLSPALQTVSGCAAVTVIGQYTVKIDVYNEAGEVVKQIYLQQLSQPVNNIALESSDSITSLHGADNAVTVYYRGAPIATWDGTTDNGNPASNGTYYIKVDNVDSAGNVSSTTQQVTVSRSLAKSTILIYNEAGEEVKNLVTYYDDPGQAAVASNVQMSGTVIAPGAQGGSVPTQLTITLSTGMAVTWDGTGNSGNYVQSGQYFVEIHTTNGSGSETTIIKQVSVDARSAASGLGTVWAAPNLIGRGAGPVTFYNNGATGLLLRISLYTTAGELVKTASGDNGTNPPILDTGSLASGAYIAVVELRNPAGGGLLSRQTRKIVVVH